jgi:hypothetical protein
VNNPNKYLFNCFNAEKARHPDMTVFYRKEEEKRDASMRYTGNEGILTVLFLKNGCEEFYFKLGTQKGIGRLIQSIDAEGNVTLSAESSTDVPKAFLDIARDYIVNRDKLKLCN